MSLRRRIAFPQNLTRTVDRRPTRVAYALPTFFTAGNMFFGFVAVMKAFEGTILMARGLPGANLQFVIAAQMIGLAVLLDGLDGRIARMTNTTSDFGREMDSLADAITFGVAPAVLGFAWGFHGINVSGGDFVRDHLLRLGYFVCFLYLLSGCARLARFNITTNPVPKNPGRPDRKYFVGLPIPAAAGLVAAVVYAAEGEPIRFWLIGLAWLYAAWAARIPDGLHLAVSKLQGPQSYAPTVDAAHHLSWKLDLPDLELLPSDAVGSRSYVCR